MDSTKSGTHQLWERGNILPVHGITSLPTKCTNWIPKERDSGQIIDPSFL